jgi:hypothetical protein
MIQLPRDKQLLMDRARNSENKNKTGLKHQNQESMYGFLSFLFALFLFVW